MEKLMPAFLLLLTFKILIPFNNGHRDHMLHKSPEEQNDGPYVHYKGHEIFVQYIMETDEKMTVKTDTIALKQKDNVSLNVMTDIPGKSFHVQLKKQLLNEKSEFPGAKTLLALSDIEGNFGAFRKLLLANKVIDENFNWKFGDGDLVLIGDFFDRGEQVTEILWLIYHLEEQAKAAGGYVHFILGNHEIMNLTGDLRYINEKYTENAVLLNCPYVTLYDGSSELGRWLRTKNIIEKIGDIVFVHGGISANINSMNLSVPGINNMTRPYYDDTTFNYTDERVDTILTDAGPFWYRGYYDKSDRHIPAQIDNTLSQFGANHIVTGHTIVSDTISVWYNGKLLDTDVLHVAGKSEALLIENNKYYRVDPSGKKVLLMEPKN